MTSFLNIKSYSFIKAEMKKCFMLFVLVFLFLDFGRASADWSPVGIGFSTSFQFPDKNDDVYGLRVSYFFSENKNIYGFDLGVYGVVSGSIKGVQSNVVSFVGNVSGVQFGSLNHANNVKGIQIGSANNLFCLVGENCGKSLSGVQVAAFLNIFETVNGVQLVGFVNSAGNLNGIQAGLFNFAENAKGLQIGLFNYAGTMKGVQIGLVNVIESNETMKYVPIINASF